MPLPDEHAPNLFCSIVIATYNPDPVFFRELLASVDAQSLPADEFEVILSDDGSTEESLAELRAIAAQRDNFRLLELESSGWPCRPRNEGVKRSDAEFVLFMDHDDVLYPEALKAAKELSRQTAYDVINVNEVRTNHWTWAWEVFGDPDSTRLVDGRLRALLPMTPHKLYRRSFLVEQQIEFIEDGRVLWEDIRVNVAAFARGARVGVLRGVPFYHWRTHDGNNSGDYGEDRHEIWEHLPRLYRFFAAQELPSAERDWLFAHWLKQHGLGMRGGRALTATAAEQEFDTAQARQFIEQYLTPDVGQHLAPIDVLRAAVLRSESDPQADLITLARTEAETIIAPMAIGTHWEGQDLVFEVRTPILFGESLLPVSLSGTETTVELPAPILNGTVPSITSSAPWHAAVITRARRDRQSHTIAAGGSVEQVTETGGGTGAQSTITTRWPVSDFLDSHPASHQPWDIGLRLASPIKVTHRSVAVENVHAGLWPAVLHGREIVAYRNASGNLSVDVGGGIRSALLDALGLEGLAGTRVWQARLDSELLIPLEHLHVFGDEELRVTGRFLRSGRGPADAKATILPDSGRGVLRLDIGGLKDGRHELQIKALRKWQGMGFVEIRPTFLQRVRRSLHRGVRALRRQTGFRR